ncbi:MAG: hypothetical protein SGJ11_03945 [Phycisphaerae bacterium]|nr:hypothetical protein [Phycisphaerae bacterium]
MHDISPTVQAGLAAAAVIAVWAAATGRRGRCRPACRACGRDARPFASSEEPTCACGVRLDQRGAIRLLRRRTVRGVVASLVLTALALSFPFWAANVHGRANGWRDELPNWLFVRLLTFEPSYAAQRSLERRIAETRDRETATVLLRGALDAADGAAIGSVGDLSNWVQRSFAILGPLASPEGELGGRLAATAFRLVDVVVTSTSTGPTLEVSVPGSIDTAQRRLFVRINEIMVNGAAAEFALTARLRRGSSVADQQWHVLARGPVKWAVEVPPTTTASDVLVKGEVVYCPVTVRAAVDQFLPRPDPADWNAPVGVARFERVAAEVQRRSSGAIAISVPPPMAAPRASFVGPDWWTASPAAFSAPRLVAMSALGLLAGTTAFLLWKLAQRIARRREALTRPVCDRCGSTILDTGSARPERCTECGAGLRTDTAMRYVAPSALGARLAGALAALGIAGIIAVFAGPIGASWLETALTPTLLSPDGYGAWLADEALSANESQIRTQLQAADLPSPDMMSETAGEVMATALALFARRWHDGVGLGSSADRVRSKRQPRSVTQTSDWSGRWWSRRGAKRCRRSTTRRLKIVSRAFRFVAPRPVACAFFPRTHPAS